MGLTAAQKILSAHIVDGELFTTPELGIRIDQTLTQDATGKAIAYLTENVEGISGRAHEGAACKNPSACDWRAYIDVSKYEPGVYSVSVVLCYKNEGKNAYRHYEMGPLQSFTVKDGEVIMPVTVSGIE